MNNTESNLISFAPFENLHLAVEATKGESKSFYQAIGFPWMVRDKDRAFLACSGDNLADFSKECAWRILAWSIHLERELQRVFRLERDASAAKLSEPGAIERFERDFADAGIWGYLREDLQQMFRIKTIHRGGRVPYDLVVVLAVIRSKMPSGLAKSMEFRAASDTKNCEGKSLLGYSLLSVMDSMIGYYSRDSEHRMMLSYAFLRAMEGLSEAERSNKEPFIFCDPAVELPQVGADGKLWSVNWNYISGKFWGVGRFWGDDQEQHTEIPAISSTGEDGYILVPNSFFISDEDRVRLRVAGPNLPEIYPVYATTWDDWAWAHIQLALREESSEWKAKVMETHSFHSRANLKLLKAAYEANRRSGRSVEVLPLSKFQK